MFCKKCGSSIPEGAKFCKKCGAPTKSAHDKEDGKNVVDKQGPDSQNNPLQEDPDRKKDKRNHEDNQKRKTHAGKRIGKIILVVFLLLLVLAAILIMLKYFGIIGNGTHRNGDDGGNEVTLKGEILEDDSYRVQAPDADEYFNQKSQIISEIDADSSDSVETEKDVKSRIEERGFSEYPITSDYSMDGEVVTETEITSDSSEKHPMYQSYHMTANRDLWIIYSINGAVMANPVSYNMQSGRDVQILLSESDTVMSYDSTKNKFYETIPNTSELIVIRVDRIDVKTLENYTIEVIDGL